MKKCTFCFRVISKDNIIAQINKKTGETSYLADFVFEISEIQKTGKYRVTIQKAGSRYYRETIIDKTVNIIPQKDASFNFTIVDAQIHTPNQGGYAGARGAIGILQNFGIIPAWLGQAGHVAVDIAQSNDLPNNTQTAYIFALRYIDGELKGLVNVVQKFANPNQQRTLENGLHKNRMFNGTETIHHSDRGIQYCCPDYKQFADKLGFKMSNTQQYDPYENAVAERVNETLKYEFGLKRKFVDLKEVRKAVAQAVWLYNNKRVHWSLGLKTPQQVHQSYDSVKYKSYSKPKKIG